MNGQSVKSRNLVRGSKRDHSGKTRTKDKSGGLLEGVMGYIVCRVLGWEGKTNGLEKICVDGSFSGGTREGITSRRV